MPIENGIILVYQIIDILIDLEALRIFQMLEPNIVVKVNCGLLDFLDSIDCFDLVEY